MKDSAARSAVVEALIAYRDGVTSNRDLERVLISAVKGTSDAELRTACDEIWNIYDDLRTYKNDGSEHLTEAELTLLEKWLLRLRAD